MGGSASVRFALCSFPRRLKEIMRIMGLNDSVHWLTWFILCTTVMLLIAFALVLLLKVSTHHHTDGSDATFCCPSLEKLRNSRIWPSSCCSSSAIHSPRSLSVFSSACSSIERISPLVVSACSRDDCCHALA